MSRYLSIIFILVTFEACIPSPLKAQWVQVSREPGYKLGVTSKNSLLDLDLPIPIRTTDFGNHWQPVDTLASFPAYAQAFTTIGSNLFAGTGDSGIFRSMDDGINWTSVSSGLHRFHLDTSIKTLWIWSLGTVGTDIVSAIYLTPEGHLSIVARSSDSGATWSEVSSLNDQFFGSIAFATSGSNLFASNSDHVYLSSDLGNNWIEVDSGIPYGACIDILYYDSNDTIFAGNGCSSPPPGVVFRSTDNGSRWKESDNGLALNAPNALLADGGFVFAATDEGLFFSKDGGSIWQRDYELTDTTVYALAVDGPYLFAGTDSGVWRQSLLAFVNSSVGPEATSQQAISLFPNPTAGPVTVGGAAGSVTVTNVLGAVVDASGYREPSSGSVELDLSRLPAGTYVARIATPGGIVVRNILKE